MVRPLVRVVALVVACAWTCGCVETRLETRKHPLQIETQPPGAQVWIQDESGKRLVGQSPVQVEQAYQTEAQSFDRWLWVTVAGSALGAGLGGFLSYNGYVDREYGYGQMATGIAIASLSTVGLVVSLVYCILGEQADGASQPTPQQIVVGADLAGHMSKSQELEIPGMSDPIVLSLPPVAATEPSAAKAGPARAIVAVFDLQDDTGKLDPTVVVRLTNYLSTVLVQHGAFRVVPRNQLRARLLEEKLGTYKACYDENCQIELGKAVAAQKTLATTLMPIGAKCTLTANLVDLKTETAEKGASIEAICSEEELIKALNQIAGQLSR